MTIASISETKAKLSALLERVKAGESITITDRGNPVAQLVPLVELDDAEWEARVMKLEHEGLITRPRRKLEPDWLNSRPLPTSRKSVLEALLEERRDSER
jgi:prevent-host-death family protein